MSGSILAGTAEHRLVSIETHLAIESDQEPDVIAAAVDQAERMCFVLDAIRQPHEVAHRTSLNGTPLCSTSPASGGCLDRGRQGWAE